MSQSVAILLAKLVEDASGLSDTCLKLGLLLERHRSIHADTSDGTWSESLGEELFHAPFSDDDYHAVVDALITYVSSSASPNTGALWALEKSRDDRVIPHLLRIVRQVSPDIDREAIAHQALHGVIVLGVHSVCRDESLACLREVAANGSPAIKEEAVKYIRHYDKITKKK